MNNAQFKGHLMLLAEMTNKDLSTPLVQYWWQTFGNLPDDTLLAAFALAKQSCEFFPAPAKFQTIVEQVAGRGLATGGAAVWEEMHRTMFSVWSEARDRVMVQENTRYPWPNDLARSILRDHMNLTTRRVAEMHPKDYEAARERFIKQYDSAQAVERAEAAIEGPKLRALPDGEVAK